MLDETKVLLRGAIAEAMSQGWDQAAVELLEILIQSSESEPSPDDDESPDDVKPTSVEKFIHGIDRYFLPYLESRRQTVFKASDFMDWAENGPWVFRLNSADRRLPNIWKRNAKYALKHVANRQPIYLKPGSRTIYSTVPFED